MNTKNKPIVEMGEDERQEMWDSLNLGGTFRMIQNARIGKDQDLLIAATVLLPCDRYIFTVLEYGDNQGIGMAHGMAGEIVRTPGLLVDGESVVVRIMRCYTHEIMSEGPYDENLEL